MSSQPQKNKALAVILSFIIPGLGLLYADGSNSIGKFLFSCLCSWLLIPWILGMVWSASAVDRVNAGA